MAIVSKADPSKDKMVRKVEVTYKNGQTPTTVSRAVQKLIVLVPNENKANWLGSQRGIQSLTTAKPTIDSINQQPPKQYQLNQQLLNEQLPN